MKSFNLALRMLKNYRLYSVVNIAGLALSLACTIALARYLYAEYTVDNCHSNVKSICGILADNKTKETVGLGYNYIFDDDDNMTAAPLPEDAAVLLHTTIAKLTVPILQVNELEYTGNILRVDSTFFQMFDFPIADGDPHVCAGAADAAITKEYGEKLFGKQNPIGKSFILDGKLLTIKTVMDAPSTKCTVQFDMLINYHYLSDDNGSGNEVKFGFVQLSPQHTAEELNLKYPDYDDNMRYRFISLKDLYFTPSYCAIFNKVCLLSGDSNSVRVLLAVAVIVLLIGIFNFINIYTVLTLRRAREMGLKKIFGASTYSIVSGIYIENLIMVSIAVIIGWILTLAGENFLMGKLGIPMTYNGRFDLLLTLSLLLILPAITAAYPYLKNKYAIPIISIQKISAGRGSIIGRAFFLVLQYIMTIVIVIVSIFFVHQLNNMLSADIGYNSHGIIQVRMFMPISQCLTQEQTNKERTLRTSNKQVVEQKMDACPLFTDWQYAASPIKNGFNSSFPMYLSLNGGEYIRCKTLNCNQQYLKLFGLRLKEGRWLQDSTDKWNGTNIVVNESFLQKFHISDYNSALLQTKKNSTYHIVGVVEDFQTGHIKFGIEPMVITPAMAILSDWQDLCALIVPGKEAEAINFLRQLHHEVGNGEFNYTMIEDEIASVYAEDKKVTIIYSLFAIIAIFIGSLGLFSLSLYDIQQRYREIALRRVNGATVKQIITMLLHKYYLLLGIAFVIAMPMSWLAIHWYMRDFVIKTSMPWWIYMAAAIITATISLLTLIYQTIKAAHTNPAIAIKAE